MLIPYYLNSHESIDKSNLLMLIITILSGLLKGKYWKTQ